MEAILRRQLKKWQRDFREREKREPTRNDIMRDAEAAAAYDTWHALSIEKDRAKDHDAPLSPKRAAVRSKPPQSPSNPFRSPWKDNKRAHAPARPYNPLHSPRAKRTRPPPSPSNPFRSPRHSTARESAAAQDSDISSDDEQVLQRGPIAQRETTQTEETSAPAQPAATPRKRISTATYTPRTKARRMLRGDDVQTPPKRTPHVKPLASPRANSCLFRAGSGATDEFGPSPRKRADQEVRGFRPMFHSQSVAPPPSEPAPKPAPEPDYMHDLQPESDFDADSEHGVSPSLAPTKSGSTVDDIEAVSLDVDGHRVAVRPYRPFGTARARHSDKATPPDSPTEPSSPVLRLGGLVLNSPVRQGARAAAQARARDERVLHSLIEVDDEPPETFRRVGRSGLDVEEDAGDTSDGWASEASSADYGWGDGAMDELDIV